MPGGTSTTPAGAQDGESFNRYYYSRLIEIWTHQDRTFWTASNIFLVVEGLFFVALYHVWTEASQNYEIYFSLATLGFVVSICWVLVCGRWREAMLLIEHQARHLEMNLFAGRSDSFPMYFWGNRAVFWVDTKKSKDGKRRMIPEDEIVLEYSIRTHHVGENSDPIKESLTSPFSSNRMITRILPMLFASIWTLVAFLSLDGYIDELTTSEGWTNAIESIGSTLDDLEWPGVYVAVAMGGLFAYLWSVRRQKQKALSKKEEEAADLKKRREQGQQPPPPSQSSQETDLPENTK